MVVGDRYDKNVRGFYKFKAVDKEGNTVKESEWMENTVVNSYAFIMTQLFLNKSLITANSPFMAIGTDDTAATTADLALGAESNRVATTVTKADYVSGGDMFQSSDLSQINCIDITGEFPIGVAVLIKEIGIFWGVGAANVSNTGWMFSRKVLAGGWDKTADIRLICVYRITFRAV